MPSLYRDYRPENFSQIIGQNHVKVTLSNEIRSATLAHAYLFCGPRAVGKTTFARILAKSINCINRKDGDFEPCGECDNCRAIKEGRDFDVVEIDAASNTGVDNVRDNIISFAKLPPSSGKYKVFIIDEVHMLSTSAFNALLKVLEEPPHYVVFILCTTEVHKVPSTIISRCERFDFRKISFADVVKKLSYISSKEKIDIDQDVLEAIARQADGHLRDAESLLGQIMSLGEKRIGMDQAELIIPRSLHNEILDLLSFLSSSNTSGAIRLVNSLVEMNVPLKEFTKESIEVSRKMLLEKVGGGNLASISGPSYGDSFESKLGQIAKDISEDKIIKIIRMLLAIYGDPRTSPLPQLPLEISILEFCGNSKPAAPIVRSQGDKSAMSSQVGNHSAVSGELNEADTSVSYSLEEVRGRWPQILSLAKKNNHSLMFVLQNCVPSEIGSGRLTLSFRYKFHNDRFNDPSIKKMVEDFVSQVFDGKKIVILTEVGESEAAAENEIQAQAQSASNGLGGLLQSLGGGELIG